MVRPALSWDAPPSSPAPPARRRGRRRRRRRRHPWRRLSAFAPCLAPRRLPHSLINVKALLPDTDSCILHSCRTSARVSTGLLPLLHRALPAPAVVAAGDSPFPKTSPPPSGSGRIKNTAKWRIYIHLKTPPPKRRGRKPSRRAATKNGRHGSDGASPFNLLLLCEDPPKKKTKEG